MTNRREFLQVGVAVAAAPLGAAALAAGSSESRLVARVDLYKVLYDVRFPASVAFANRLAAEGGTVVPMSGDMTRFWYDDLYRRWKRGPVVIAGLTAYGALFCLEQLAWAERMRVVFRARHTLADDGCMRHTIEGPESLVGALERTASRHDWPSALADAVRRCPAGPAHRAIAEVRTALPEADIDGAEPLYSWIIAPVARG